MRHPHRHHKEVFCLHSIPTSDSRCLEAAGTTAAACLQPLGSLQAADTPLPAARTANRRDPASGAMGVRLSFAAATPALQTFTIFSLASLLREEVVLLRVATVDTTCREQDRTGRSGWSALGQTQTVSALAQALHSPIWQAPRNKARWLRCCLLCTLISAAPHLCHGLGVVNQGVDILCQGANHRAGLGGDRSLHLLLLSSSLGGRCITSKRGQAL